MLKVLRFQTRRFLSFFLSVAITTHNCTDLYDLYNFEREPPKNHLLCKVSLQLAQWYRKRCRLKSIVDARRLAGELKTERADKQEV